VLTLLERDLPQLGVRIPAAALLRFWTMLAHYHGNIWNAAEPARSLGISQPTVRQYLDVLTEVFMVRQLQPWRENLLKRHVKAPKIFIRDSGLLHLLIGIRTERDLLSHPKLGSSWEGYAIEEVLKLTEPDSAYFWTTHSGAELDLLLFKHGRRYGVEIRREDAPRGEVQLGCDHRLRQATSKFESLPFIFQGASTDSFSKPRLLLGATHGAPVARTAVLTSSGRSSVILASAAGFR